MQRITDLVRAHWKAIIAAVALVLVQEVDDNTADWIITVLGLLGVAVKQNNPESKQRIYGRRD